MSNDQDRQAIRKIIQQKRNELSQIYRDDSAKAVANSLTQLDIFKQSMNIACYIATGSEINTQPIIEAIFKNNKKCYLPVIDFEKIRTMNFIEYQKCDDLIKNRFGILEPRFNQQKIIPPEKLDLVIMPLIAFDREGHRIGSGGGYYDEAFSFINKNKKQPHPILCGLAYSFQEVNDIEPQDWDIGMAAMLTELGIIFSE